MTTRCGNMVTWQLTAVTLITHCSKMTIPQWNLPSRHFCKITSPADTRYNINVVFKSTRCCNAVLMRYLCYYVSMGTRLSYDALSIGTAARWWYVLRELKQTNPHTQTWHYVICQWYDNAIYIENRGPWHTGEVEMGYDSSGILTLSWLAVGVAYDWKLLDLIPALIIYVLLVLFSIDAHRCHLEA